MCGRVTITVSKKELEEYFHASFPSVFIPTYNGVPAQFFPIVRNVNPEKIELAKWGFLPKWLSKKRTSGFINSKSEEIFEKPTFKRAILNQKCLVPVSGFFEWQNGTRIPYYIRARNRSIFSLAGIWENFKNDQGKDVLTFSILTTQSSLSIRGIHDRMPVILKKEDELPYLKAEDPDEIRKFLKPFDDLDFYSISKMVNSPKNNFAEILQPAPPELIKKPLKFKRLK